MDLNDLRQRTAAAPDFVEYWVQLAVKLEKEGHATEAAEAWRMAHRLVPNSPLISEAVDRLAGVSDEDLSPSPEIAATIDDGEVATTDARLDIDVLISDLESGRTRSASSPDRLGDAAEDDAAPQNPESDELATETLARIYEAQNLFAEAAKMYQALADREKDAAKSEILRARADDLRRKSSSGD